jgi:hypothetical protein
MTHGEARGVELNRVSAKGETETKRGVELVHFVLVGWMALPRGT